MNTDPAHPASAQRDPSPDAGPSRPSGQPANTPAEGEFETAMGDEAKRMRWNRLECEMQESHTGKWFPCAPADLQNYFEDDRCYRRRPVRREQPASGGEVEGTGAIDFQGRVHAWLLKCFGSTIAYDKQERCDRFLEESLELVQSLGYASERAHALVDYVFNRSKGEPSQELGGVMVTLAALCVPHELDMVKAAETELARITRPEIVEKIRAKQAAKPTGSALPVSTPSTSAIAQRVAEALCNHSHLRIEYAGHGDRWEMADITDLLPTIQAALGEERISPQDEIRHSQLLSGPERLASGSPAVNPSPEAGSAPRTAAAKETIYLRVRQAQDITPQDNWRVACDEALAYAGDLERELSAANRRADEAEKALERVRRLAAEDSTAEQRKRVAAEEALDQTKKERDCAKECLTKASERIARMSSEWNEQAEALREEEAETASLQSQLTASQAEVERLQERVTKSDIRMGELWDENKRLQSLSQWIPVSNPPKNPDEWVIVRGGTDKNPDTCLFKYRAKDRTHYIPVSALPTLPATVTEDVRDEFTKWWASTGRNLMPTPDDPPEHYAVAKAAWKAAKQSNP